MAAKRGVTKTPAKRPTKRPTGPTPALTADTSMRLRALGESLERTVDEVRRGKLDRAKLLALASAIAAISRILGESLSVSEK